MCHLMDRQRAPAHQARDQQTRIHLGSYHIQNVNAYISRLKRWICRFNGVATRYLG
jgi:hypothetical protein